jgi:hypothetical protein
MAASDFFNRWSKRPDSPAPDAPQPMATSIASPSSAPQPGPQDPATLEQAQRLTPQDDFRAFVRPEVAPEVRNTAMRQLFSDPHFNVMDGLDIYIDDYNRPDPLPLDDLKRMVSAQAMRLLKSESESATGVSAAAGDALSESNPENSRDDPDLRLQPNPEPGPTGHGSGAD